MANEDDKGYPVSDEKSFDLERTDTHSQTLSSSNPALTNIKKLGIPNELPKLGQDSIKPTEKPAPVDTSSHKSLAKEIETTAEVKEDSKDGDLSSFTRWLKSLKQPEVRESELVDPVPSATPKSATPKKVAAPSDEADPVAAEPNPQLTTEKTETSQEKAEVQEAVVEKKKPKKKKKKKNRKKQADDGDPIILSDEVYSETLAELLESQGHLAEAIAMYEKLRLKYPEKSRFFAAKITKLHKKA
jgi:hypothetical protein